MKECNMNKYMRKLAIFIALIFLFTEVCYNNVYAYKKDVYEEFIPDDIQDYAIDNYKKGVDLVLSNYNMYGIEGEIEEFKLCKPYFVYDVNQSVQDPLYYFPISDEGDKVVLVMAVFRTENGLSFSIGTDISKELNEVNYLNEECIVYGDEETVCVENKNKIANDTNSFGKLQVSDELNDFVNKDFKEKERDIKDIYEVDQEVEYEESNKSDDESGFAYASHERKLLAVENAIVNQKIDGKQYGICWAATVATIYNYIMDKKIYAKDVCDSIGHKYKGASADDIKKAFEKYGLDYRLHDVLEYKKIKDYITQRKPMYMRTISEDGESRHAVTLIGYDQRVDGNYISIWNSANEQYTTMVYDGERTSYGMNHTTYHWNQTFSYK